MAKLKIGIIGVGSISNEHIQAYLKNESVTLEAFCDVDENNLKMMGEQYGITKLYTRKDEMLANEDLDAVSVCVWNAAHAECTIAALKSGVNVLCEKPMAVTLTEAKAMIDRTHRYPP